MQHHIGAPRGLFDGLEGIVALPGGLPADTFAGGKAGATGREGDLIGDDEGRVEADAELTDEMGVLALVAGQGLEELAGTRLGNGADVVDNLLAGHAAPVVGDGNRPRVFVVGHVDREIVIVLVEVRLGEGFEAQPIDGIRRIGNQLAQENLFVAIQRMDH